MSQEAHIPDNEVDGLQQSDAQITGARGTLLGNMELQCKSRKRNIVHFCLLKIGWCRLEKHMPDFCDPGIS